MSEAAQIIQQFCQAVAADLTQLAVLHDREPQADLLHSLQTIQFPHNLGLQLNSPAGQQAHALLAQALQNRTFIAEDFNKLAADFAAIYLNYTFATSPYESVWIDEGNLARQQPMFQIRNWYKHYALTASDWQNRPEDHLALQLQFIAHLFELAAQQTDPTEILKNTARFMDEHILRWINQFAPRVAGRCGTEYYAGLAFLTAAYLEELRDVLAATLNEARPTAEEIDKRMYNETQADVP